LLTESVPQASCQFVGKWFEINGGLRYAMVAISSSMLL